MTQILFGRFRRSLRCVVVSVAAAAVIVGHHASGQTTTDAAADWRHGTTLAGFVGGASPASGTGGVAGAALGWEILPHLTVEGRGLWLGGGTGSNGFAALFGARVPLLPARVVVPFVSGSVGMYRATVGPDEGSMPPFYRRRMAADGAGLQRRTFDDFVVGFGGGMDVFLAQHLALRPEVTVLMVTTRAATRAVPVYGVHLAYHFESHPITPARRSTR